MNLSANTILITGGTSRIGCALAKYFHVRNNTVIICGHRAERLAQAPVNCQGCRKPRGLRRRKEAKNGA